jgi:hypothetical protein
MKYLFFLLLISCNNDDIIKNKNYKFHAANMGTLYCDSMESSGYTTAMRECINTSGEYVGTVYNPTNVIFLEKE